MPEEVTSAQSSAEKIITTENLSSEKSRARALAFEYTARLDTLSSNVFERGLTRLNQMFFLPWNSPEEELISRVCSLAFQLQVSGGLLTAQPMKVLGKIVIDLEAAMNGFLRRESSAESTKRKRKKITAQGGSRQFLYIEGRVQTLSFIHYRLKDDSSFKGEVGGELLPSITPSIIKAALPNYPWLKRLKMNSPTWNGVYRAWLHNLFNLTDKAPNILLSDVTELAAWRLYQTEPPFICYLRRLRIRQAFLPDARLHYYYAGANILGATENNDGQFSCAIEDYQNCEEPVFSRTGQEGSNQEFDAANEVVKNWLRDVDNNPQINRDNAVAGAQELLMSPYFQSSAVTDLKLALEWIVYRIKTKREDKNTHRRLGTITTNLRRLLSFFIELRGNPFAWITTEDFAEYLESYITPSAARAQKSTVKLYDLWLKKVKGGFSSEIDWNSKKLVIREESTFYQLMTRQDFSRLLESVDNLPEWVRKRLRVAILLLRRCGLRCGEAVALKPDSLLGLFEEMRLRIRFSKTNAGRRTLPLDWLLTGSELDEIIGFIELTRSQNKEFLFYDEDEIEPLAAAKLGNLVQKAMRIAGIEDQTAHSLRHGFANDLLSTFSLRETEKTSPPLTEHVFDWAREALENDYSSGIINPETVVMFDDIRRLLGHAHDKITLMRYIHITDLMTADAVRIAETKAGKVLLGVSKIANLAGTTTDAVRKKFKGKIDASEHGQEQKVDLVEVEKWLQARLEKFIKVED